MTSLMRRGLPLDCAGAGERSGKLAAVGLTQRARRARRPHEGVTEKLLRPATDAVVSSKTRRF